MILHLGANEMVSKGDIVAIIRHESLSSTRNGRNYLGQLEASGRLDDISGGRPGGLVVLQNGRVVLSPISAKTLTRRFERAAHLNEAEPEDT